MIAADPSAPLRITVRPGKCQPRVGDGQVGSVDRAPGVEPRPAVRDRAVQGLTGMARRHPGGTVVVVSHDAVNREVLATFDAGLGDPDTIPQDNGCYNTLEWRGARWSILGVNELPQP